MGLIWWTIPTLLSLQGFSVQTITTLGASATLPWSFKFLFGPVVDRFIYTTRHHAWCIAGLQIGVGLGVFSVIITPLDSPWILYCILTMSFFSAIQDVVIDAWAIASVKANIRGKINGAMQVGMLSGRWLFGAGLLVVLSYISLNFALYIFLMLIGASILFLFFYFKNANQAIAQPQKKLSFRSLKFLSQKKYLLLALIALSTGFALEAFTSVISPFLVNYGLDREAVGAVLSFTLLFMLLGAVVGGYICDRIGDLKTFAFAVLVLAFFVGCMGFYSVFSLVVFLALVLSTYFFIGFFTSSSYTYYMNQSQGEMEASKFTFLMAITNLCEVVAAYSMGRMFSLSGDYLFGFWVCILISFIGLSFLLSFKGRRRQDGMTDSKGAL